MANIETVELAQLNFAEGAAPATPSATSSVMYVKSDGLFYSKDDAGTETLMSGGSGSSDPAWTSFTPTWTAESTAASLGNGTLTGAFITTGKTHKFRVHLTWGSTTTGGTGRWNFTIDNGTVSTAALALQVVNCYLFDNSTATTYGGPAWIGVSATPVVRPTSVGAGAGINGISTSVPFTWATSDQVHITGIIEVA